MSWRDYGWSEEYDEPSLSDLDPRSWNPFDFSWEQSMFNPDNPGAAADWVWMDVGLSASMITYLASVSQVGWYSAWNSLGGWLTGRMLSQPWRWYGIATTPAIAIPVAFAIGATVVNEFTRELIADEHEGSDMSNFGYTTPFTSGIGSVV